MTSADSWSIIPKLRAHLQYSPEVPIALSDLLTVEQVPLPPPSTSTRSTRLAELAFQRRVAEFRGQLRSNPWGEVFSSVGDDESANMTSALEVARTQDVARTLLDTMPHLAAER